MWPVVELIMGPTASGKTEYAIERARKIGARILSVDSLLVYRQLNIGSAKPSADLLQEIPHYGINLIDLESPFSVIDYRRVARQAIKETRSLQVPLLIVGGSFFYLRALFTDPYDAPATDPKIGQELNARVKEDGLRTLYKELVSLDPKCAGKINPNDQYRIIRALAIYYQTGKKLSFFSSKSKPLARPEWIKEIKIFSPEKELLKTRVIERTFQMLNHGLVEEVEDIKTKGYSLSLRPLQSVGYREVGEYLEGRISKDVLPEKIVQSTTQLAKRQMTWMRNHFAEFLTV